MPNASYQTYTEETPLDTYRSDFIRRAAMCTALAKRYPGLADVAAAAGAIVGQIDEKRAALQHAEDDEIRARAVEDAEKLDVVDVYTELRRTLSAKSYDAATLLPEPPARLARAGVKTFLERAERAIANLGELSEADPLRAAFLPRLQQELRELRAAEEAEDETRRKLQAGRTAMVLYKSELAAARAAELGTVQSVVRDRAKTAAFTLPWRKSSRSAEDEAPAAPAAPAPVG